MDQRLMRLSAEKQANERSEREGVACHVYRSGETWYVRTEVEGEPEGAVLEYTAVPALAVPTS